MTKQTEHDGHALLLRAGFLRQAYAGVFHLLPLGLRVQDKIERLIDKHMRTLGASKLSLSSISSEALWRKSGRLTGDTSELLRLNARSGPGFLLSPTHEEEITSLFAGSVSSYKDLPVRLYQVTRKYRDERRPRQGLLRTREFLMKDLYTFDVNDECALETYHLVKAAYDSFFHELQIPYLVAAADSGSIGGDYSHEYHFVTSIGEDNIVSCNQCGYVANEELAEKAARHEASQAVEVQTWTGITQDRKTLVKVFYPHFRSAISDLTGPNLHVLKRAVPTLDTGVEDPVKLWNSMKALNTAQHQTGTVSTASDGMSVLHILDQTIVDSDSKESAVGEEDPSFPVNVITHDPKSHKPLDLVRVQPGDLCAQCSTGSLKVDKAVELGHTFHLGTRYSAPLEATVVLANNKRVPMSMGCHGIGISRIIGAVASIMADEKGLNWPRAIAPFEVIIVSGKGVEEDAMAIYDILSHADGNSTGMDVVFDDRPHEMGWKLNDADLVGYPIIVVLGKAWKQKRACEVQCRQLNSLRTNVAEADLRKFLSDTLDKLSGTSQ